MKAAVHTKNIFKTGSDEALKKAVTEKIEKLINIQIRKTG